MSVSPTEKSVGNPVCGTNVWAPKELSLFTMSACLLIAVIATIGNGLIIGAVIIDPIKRLRTPFNYFLVNLSAADLILGAAIMPLAVYTHYMESIGELTPELNNLIRMSYFIVGMASLLYLVTLSIDRYIAITRALKYRFFFSWRHCIIVSVSVWIVSTAFPFIYFKIGAVNYYMLFACTAILIGLCVLVIIYIEVYRFLRQRTNRLKDEVRTVDENTQLRNLLHEKKVTRTFLIILLLFVLTYIPAAAMVFILYFWQTDCVSRHVLRDLQSVLISSNSCVNPFICFIRMSVFQTSVKRMLNLGRRRVATTTTEEGATSFSQEEKSKNLTTRPGIECSRSNEEDTSNSYLKHLKLMKY